METDQRDGVGVFIAESLGFTTYDDNDHRQGAGEVAGSHCTSGVRIDVRRRDRTENRWDGRLPSFLNRYGGASLRIGYGR